MTQKSGATSSSDNPEQSQQASEQSVAKSTKTGKPAKSANRANCIINKLRALNRVAGSIPARLTKYLKRITIIDVPSSPGHRSLLQEPFFSLVSA